MSIHRFKYLFQRFIDKTASPTEVEEFLSMMKRDDYNEEVQALLDEFWNEPSSVTPLGEERAEKIFKKIMDYSNEGLSKRAFSISPQFYRAIAAILVIGLSVFFYTNYKKDTNSSGSTSVVTAIKKYEKPMRRFINLPDGSSVILNENSQIELAENFKSDQNREVYLMGEAYFDIAHDAKRPFIVHTGKLKTTVLGTAFNVKSSAGAKTVTVTVTRGKVKVGDEKQTFNIITPNEQVVFKEEKNNVVKVPVKAESYIKWTSEDIYFDDVNMKDVAKQLQERFGISILFSNEQIKSCKFSATFMKSQSLPQILNVIGEFNQIKYQFKDNKTVILDGSGCEE